MRNTGEGAKPPLRYSLNLSSHFRVWVTVWVRRLTHILTHTIFSVFATKKHRKPKFSMLFGAAGQIRTADLILTNCRRDFQPCCTRFFGSFLSKKDEVAACLFHCFHPHVSPCGSRCGSSGNFCIKEAADRLRRHISFYRFSLIIDSGNLLNESLLLPAGFRPRHAELSAHRKKSVIPQSVFFRFMREVPLRVFHCQPSSK